MAPDPDDEPSTGSAALPISTAPQSPSGQEYLKEHSLPNPEVFVVQYDDDESSDDDNYDMECYDDDGEPLQDEEGYTLIPLVDDKEYTEDEAREILAFAVTYRQVRGALQATRTGRDQKSYQKARSEYNRCVAESRSSQACKHVS